MLVYSAEIGRRRESHGFTLIEVMVVLLVMAVLLAIAIPTFLSSRAGAQDQSTQSDLSDALVAARATSADSGYYPAATGLISTLGSREPDLSFVKKAAKEGTNEISVNVSASGLQLVLVGFSASGVCWALSDNNGDPSSAAWGQAPLGVAYVSWNPAAKGGKACNAANAFGGKEGKALADGSWSDSYPSGTPSAKP